MLKEEIVIRVVEYVGAPSKIVARGSFRFPFSYLLEPIELLSLVFVKFGDDVREGSFQPRYDDVSKSVYATTRCLDRPVENLEIALQRRQFDQQIDRLLVIYLQSSHLLAQREARQLFTTETKIHILSRSV